MNTVCCFCAVNEFYQPSQPSERQQNPVVVGVGGAINMKSKTTTTAAATTTTTTSTSTSANTNTNAAATATAATDEATHELRC